VTLHGVVRAHRAQQVRAATRAQRAAMQVWQGRRGPLLAGWSREIPELVRVVRGAMTVAATDASGYVAATLAAQGAASEMAYVSPIAFGRVANDGRALGGLMYLPAITTSDLLSSGASSSQAMRAGLNDLLMYVGSEVADAGRSAVSVAMLGNTRVRGYYREPGAGACDRCAVLSGRWYSTFQGASFDRHPRCQCSAIPAVSKGDGNPVARSPAAYFDGLSAERQEAVFGKANAQAIRDGADVSQVVNARSGMTGQWATTTGTTRRATYGGHTARGLAGAPRLTPAAIYRLAATREEAVAMFREYGYLL
jgi:hypothetical protein